MLIIGMQLQQSTAVTTKKRLLHKPKQLLWYASLLYYKQLKE